MDNPKEEKTKVNAAAKKEAENCAKTGSESKQDSAEKTNDDSKKTKQSEDNKNEGKEQDKEKEKENELFVEFSIEVTKEEIEKDFEEAAAKYSGEVKLAGFRKGKVPIEVVKSRFKEVIIDEVINKAIEKAVFERIDKDKLKIATSPMVEKVDHKEGENLKADIKVEIFPEITLPDLEKIKIEVPAKEWKLDEYDEQKQIDAFLESNRRKVQVTTREIKDEDHVKIKYQSKLLDTKRMTPKKESDYIVNKKGEFEILDLYPDIIGKKLEDKIIVKRKYPADFKKKIWAGKEIEHHIDILSISELVKPTLTDELLQTVGIKDEESFKKQLKEDYERYEQNQKDNKISQLIVEKLNETVEFPVPQSLVEQEAARMISQYAPKPIDFQNDKKAREMLAPFKPQAEKSIKFSLIVETIKENFKIEVASEDLEKEYKMIAEKNNFPVKEVRKYYLNSKKDSQSLKESLLNVKIMEFLKEKVTIKEV
jgi:trigger factor